MRFDRLMILFKLRETTGIKQLRDIFIMSRFAKALTLNIML